jgi:GTP-binding protein YchF
MKCRVGLLGLPNVGKSSLFNALAQQSIATAANFPFCTIDPSVAPVPVPDPYLQPLGEIAGSTTLRPATIEWVDVAGLAPNAHKGEGLGNQFLANLRECHALCHVVRTFEDYTGTSTNGANDASSVCHVTGRVNPIQDIELIDLELLLADVDHVQRRLAKTTCQASERCLLEKIAACLEAGKPARSLGLTFEEQFLIKGMGLLTLKPILYAFNVDDIDFTIDREQTKKRISTDILPSLQRFESSTTSNSSSYVYEVVCAKLESHLCELYKDAVKRHEHVCAEYGIEELGRKDADVDIEPLFSYSTLPKKIMQLLNLSIVYTGPGVPPERSRTTKAHLFSASQKSSPWTANDLAGNLHGEIQRGFIRAEVISAPDLIQCGSISAAKDEGRVRTEGRNYRIAPDDVVLVKWK